MRVPLPLPSGFTLLQPSPPRRRLSSLVLSPSLAGGGHRRAAAGQGRRRERRSEGRQPELGGTGRRPERVWEGGGASRAASPPPDLVGFYCQWRRREASVRKGTGGRARGRGEGGAGGGGGRAVEIELWATTGRGDGQICCRRLPRWRCVRLAPAAPSEGVEASQQGSHRLRRLLDDGFLTSSSKRNQQRRQAMANACTSPDLLPESGARMKAVPAYVDFFTPLNNITYLETIEGTSSI